MYRLEIRRRLRVPSIDYRQEKQELLQKELQTVLEKVSEIAVTMVTKPASVNNSDFVGRRERELFEIEQRLKIEMLLMKARLLTAKTTGRNKNKRQMKKCGQEKKRVDRDKKKDDQQKKRDGKQGKKRGREEEGSGLSGHSGSGKRKRA